MRVGLRGAQLLFGAAIAARAQCFGRRQRRPVSLACVVRAPLMPAAERLRRARHPQAPFPPLCEEPWPTRPQFSVHCWSPSPAPGGAGRGFAAALGSPHAIAWSWPSNMVAAPTACDLGTPGSTCSNRAPLRRNPPEPIVLVHYGPWHFFFALFLEVPILLLPAVTGHYLSPRHEKQTFRGVSLSEIGATPRRSIARVH